MRPESSNGIVLTVTATSIVAARNCIVTSLSLNPAAAACTVSLYDPLPFIGATGLVPGTSAGTPTTVNAVLRVTLSNAASVGSVSSCINTSGIEFVNGCLAVVTGAGATANIGWQVI